LELDQTFGFAADNTVVGAFGNEYNSVAWQTRIVGRAGGARPMTQEEIDQTFEIGFQHYQARRLAEAERVCRQVLNWQPNHVRALDTLGQLMLQGGRPDVALRLAQKVVALLPDSAAAHNNLGIVLKDNGQPDEALRHLAKAVELDPKIEGAWANMGIVYMEQGRHDRAIQCFRRSMAQQPDVATRHSDLLYAMQYCPEYDAAMILAEHREWARRFELPLASTRRPHANKPDPERRLRIGYLSADLSDHPVGRFLLPLFAHHDHQLFEICCYSDVTRLSDATGQSLQRCADRWLVTRGLGDADLSEQIQRDEIDILVDLAQHTGGNRLLVFARKPAPVQASWLGYPGTTGLEAIDYRITDPYLDPPGQGDESYSERSIRLPHCFWCYRPLDFAPVVNALPAGQNGYVTFGCMNRFEKMTAPTLQMWRQILLSVPQSRLLIHSKIGDHLDPVRRFFAEGGIAPRRVEFIERKGMFDYFPQYYRMDIGLDSFPHGGGTVTCDALWMGVPVVTLAGRTVVSRAGKSLLSNVGLQELIAHSPEEYVTIAAGLAANIPKLTQMRQSLRHRMAASALMDAKRFANDMESAYRQMWRTWCSTD
jgi:predicted O-linked N-acetylglucosamine transferase (SPINDLY family)